MDEALSNPGWMCPMCLDECNCSSCRRKLGKNPVSIATRDATKQGFRSVYHMLHGLGEDEEGFTGTVTGIRDGSVGDGDFSDDGQEEEEEEEEEPLSCGVILLPTL